MRMPCRSARSTASAGWPCLSVLRLEEPPVGTGISKRLGSLLPSCARMRVAGGQCGMSVRRARAVPRRSRLSRAISFVSQLASETWDGRLGRPLPASSRQRSDEAARAGYLERRNTAAMTDYLSVGDLGPGERSSSGHSPVSERIELLERRYCSSTTTSVLSRATTDSGRHVLHRAFIARRNPPSPSPRAGHVATADTRWPGFSLEPQKPFHSCALGGTSARLGCAWSLKRCCRFMRLARVVPV